MKVGGDGDIIGDGVGLLAWVDASERAATHLAARPAELSSRPLDRVSVTSISTAMIVRSLHDPVARDRIGRRIADLRRACARGSVGISGGSSPGWTGQPGAEDRGFLLAVLGALRDEASETGSVPMRLHNLDGLEVADELVDAFEDLGLPGVDAAIAGLSQIEAQGALRVIIKAHLKVLGDLEDRRTDDD